jgi:adenylate cyclase
MTRIIFEHRGTIDKYVGDMIMAFWGAPVADEQHARHAIEAAQEMLAEVEKMKPEFKRLGLPEVNIGIGLNTGPMNVGDMGSQYRRAYTVLGDSVNLASRLEGLTKFYGVELVVSEATKQHHDQLLYRHLDLVKVKGKKQAVKVYEPLCLKTQADHELLDELQQHERGIECYLTQQWDHATQIFTQLSNEHPDTHIYTLYLERIDSLRSENLGTDWDGVYERRTK